MTTTLNLLRKHRACKERYAHLVAALGGVNADHDAPINLLTILEHNGVGDVEWVLEEGATVEDCAPLLAEYQRQRDSLWAEYERQSDSLLAEYKIQRVPLWAEYQRQSVPLWAEYERQSDLLLAEYERQRVTLLAALLEASNAA